MIAKKRILAVLVTVLMAFAMMPMAAGTVYAESPFVILCVDWFDVEQKVYLDEDNFISDHDTIPPIGYEVDEGIVVEGYYSDIEYTKPVDVHSRIPDELIGKKIYVKLAAEDAYIFVQGIKVTKENQADVLGDQTVSFDYDTMTLTLKNADLTVTEEYPAIINASYLPVTLRLEGKNTMTGSNLQESNYGGIFSYGRLRISGPGSLSISLENILVPDFAGVYVENDLTVSSDLDINISNTSSSDVDSYGLVALGKTEFDGTHTTINVTATGQGQTVGIGSQYGGITIKGDSDVNVNANVGIYVGRPTDQLNVLAGSRIELSCGWAFRNVDISDATKALGVQIKTSADAAAYELWDGTTDLTSEDIKCILIPGKDISHVKAKEATCATAGNTEYWTVTEGGNTRYYSDVGYSHEVASLDEFRIPATGKHTWDNGKVTKEPTATTKGVKTYTCKVCGKTKTEVIPAKGNKPAPAPGSDSNQKGSDGTAVGPGASAAAAEKAIVTMNTDTDPKGAVFAKLKLKSPKQAKTSISLKWTKLSKAKKYVIYGNKCGKINKPVKLATVTGTTKTFNKINSTKIKKGTYYKFIVVALDKDNTVVSTSKLIHVATKGGKVTNHKSVEVKRAVINKAKNLKKGRTLKLAPTTVKQVKKLKVRKHAAMRYESTNKAVATVSKSGVVKAKKKGTAYIYAYAQSGMFKKVRVLVK